jgi:hypothetical protein
MSHRIPTGYRDTGKNVAFADEVLEARGPGLVGQRAFDWNGFTPTTPWWPALWSRCCRDAAPPSVFPLWSCERDPRARLRPVLLRLHRRRRLAPRGRRRACAVRHGARGAGVHPRVAVGADPRVRGLGRECGQRAASVTVTASTTGSADHHARQQLGPLSRGHGAFVRSDPA